MKPTRQVSPPRPSVYISSATAHYLYPGLPLDKLTKHDGLYESLAVFDLAETLALRHLAVMDVVDAGNTDQDVAPALPVEPEWKLVQLDELLVQGKPYFSTRITAQRTGYSMERLRRLANQADTGIDFVRYDIPNGSRAALFFDLDSVLAYLARQE